MEKSHEFEGEQEGGVFGRIWGGGKGEMELKILSKINKN